MEQLTDYLNAEKTDLMEILFSKNLPDGREAREWFLTSGNTVKAEVEPILLTYLDSLQLSTLAASKSSVEELEAINLRLIPENFNQQLAISIDKLEGFTMPQRFWMFSVMLGDFGRAAAEYMRSIFHKRAQEIVRFHKSLVLQ